MIVKRTVSFTFVINKKIFTKFIQKSLIIIYDGYETTYCLWDILGMFYDMLNHIKSVNFIFRILFTNTRY